MRQILLIIIGLSVSLLADFRRDNVAKIVIDNTTGLQWQDDAVSSTMNWSSALVYCKNLTLGEYNDWRLPNIKELTSLVDNSRINPAIYPIFKHCVSYDYWSSTTSIDDFGNGDAWVISFNYGYQPIEYKSNSTYVRCVRAGK